MLVQSLIERLRPLVGIKGWDYIILWKLSNGHRSIEWIDCCCAGSENAGHGGEELISFPSSSSSSSSTSSRHPCRDIMFPHPRISSCDLLDQLPSAIVLLDSGVHAQTLLSNQISWLNYSHNSDSCLPKETGLGTRVLIPLSLSLGLLELFVAKQVPEDQQVIDFIRSQCNIFMEQQAISNPGTMDSFSSDLNAHQKDHSLAFLQQQIFADPSKETLDLPRDISIDRIHLCTSPLNTLQQFSNTLENGNTGNDVFLEGTAYESNIFTPSVENGLQDMEAATQGNMMGNSSRWMEPLGAMEEQMNDDSFICENNRSDESDPNDDEDDAKYRRRTGKGPQSKNLVAERKRRKKLNDRLYSLRALVPKISKLDRASILGDAIDYVKELQKQVKDLQIELEEHSDDEETGKASQGDAAAEKCIPPSVVNQNGAKRGPKRQHGNLVTGFHNLGSSDNAKNSSKQHHEQHNSANERVQQMEPQVEVFQLDGNDFFVKVFCEHKSGGFVRLMEALNSLGLEVTNANATRHTCLVSSIFKVERKNDDIVQADHVKESLLELTRNPSRLWLNAEDETDNVVNKRESDYHDALICGRQMNSQLLQRMQQH